MSKLALIRQYQYSPAAGGGILSIIGAAAKGVGKFVGAGIKAVTKSKAAKAVQQVVNTPWGQAVLYTGAGVAAGKLMAGGQEAMPGPMIPPIDMAGFRRFGKRRRSRGITARELRGYRKVANLLHKEGMVSRRARRGHS